MSKTNTISKDQLISKMSQPGPMLNSKPIDRLPAPTTEQPITLNLEQLRPYDRNPRTQRNPKYEEIKASIRAVGLKQKLTVTQRPGDDRYMISDGGNTRLSILNELYEETGDERFYIQDCHFIPWQSEINVLAGHLAENDNRGGLSWVERARGIYAAKTMIEEDLGESISQRRLTEQLRELGYTVSQSNISKMLYTIDYFLPTIPMTLDSGMGRPQIEKLISYRQFCDECWQRCKAYWKKHENDLGEGESWAINVLAGDFDSAWHDEMTQLDDEGQTEFRWNIVEDRLKGMLHDQTGLHFNVIDMAWKNWFTVRKYPRMATEDEKADIWTTVDSELEHLHHPDNKEHNLNLSEGNSDSEESKVKTSASQKSIAGSSSGSKSSKLHGEEDEEIIFEEGHSNTPSHLLDQTTDDRHVPTTGGVDESETIKAMRAKLTALEERNAELEEVANHKQDHGILDTDGMLRDHSPTPTRSPDEQAHLIASLTESPYNETEGHRQLRQLQSEQYGEEPIDFEASALKSVPLMSGTPTPPITDLWHIPGWRRNPQDLRMQIGEVVQALAKWAGIDADSDIIHLNARSGLGYELSPLNSEHAPNRRAQLVWQILAGLQGSIDPMLPAEISLLGELVGSHGDDESTRLPDGLFIRIFWLTRLIRVLREQNTDGQGEPK